MSFNPVVESSTSSIKMDYTYTPDIQITDVLDVINEDTKQPIPSPIPNRILSSAYVEIVEQPASKALRFRYECEGRSAGSIPGVGSTSENKTYPSIVVRNYVGKVALVISCVTKDPPYRPHPHKITARDNCRNGVIYTHINAGEVVPLTNLGIQCVKKKEVIQSLKEREDMNVDPFNTGFSHKHRATNIDLNAVRLAFQVFIKKDKKPVPIDPVVSDVIYDKKAMCELVIDKLSHYSASVAGGMEMILLCEKVAKDDIQVRFYEEVNGQLKWEGFGDFQSTQVHKQVAIIFRTPRYLDQEIENPVKVCVELRRPSDGAVSSPVPFEITPLGSDYIDHARRKRRKSNEHCFFKQEPDTGKKPEQELELLPLIPRMDQLPPSMSTYRTQLSPARTPSPENLFKKVPETIRLSPQNFNTHFGPQSSNVYNSYGPAVGSAVYVPPTVNVQPPPNDATSFYYQQKPADNFQHPAPVYQNPVPSVSYAHNNAPSKAEDCNYDLSQLDTDELALFGTQLSENLSSGLSITDEPEENEQKNPQQQQQQHPEEEANMTDSLTRLTRNTIQELCALNQLCRGSMDK